MYDTAQRDSAEVGNLDRNWYQDLGLSDINGSYFSQKFLTCHVSSYSITQVSLFTMSQRESEVIRVHVHVDLLVSEGM